MNAILNLLWALMFPRWMCCYVNNPVIKGNSAVLWGVNQPPGTIVSGAGSYTLVGIITDSEKGSSADKIEVQDENGFVIAVVFFNHKNECSFGMVVKTAVPELVIGDTFTLAGAAFCIVEDIKAQWSNKDVTKYNVKATRYKAITADT